MAVILPFARTTMAHLARFSVTLVCVLSLLKVCHVEAMAIDARTGEELIQDPDFPDYWQLPAKTMEPDNDLSLAAVAPGIEYGPLSNTLPPLASGTEDWMDTSGTGIGDTVGTPMADTMGTRMMDTMGTRMMDTMGTRMMGPQATRVPGKCQKPKEKSLIDMLGNRLEGLRQFTPVSFCANDRRNRRQRMTIDNRTPSGQRPRYNIPTSCDPVMMGKSTMCPWKVTCDYDEHRYPPLMYKVTCLQRRNTNTNQFACPWCRILTRHVWVLRMSKTAPCLSNGKEAWYGDHIQAPWGCGCWLPPLDPETK